ncbi:putative alpha-mannosidase I MNS5 [Capsicum baccatum]|uniref:Alpha-mannosidase I MNS5 n=1 Tax=Capsicum baccatum TaxID=33114 RepID=A0A2G2WC50_CAPBA|nr:putative alpha-mannosidase I MNS5 [Capsicum baccatum]
MNNIVVFSLTDPWYMEVSESMMNSLHTHTRVKGGFANVGDVTTMQLEDHQHNFFLSETCKYLYLFFDELFLLNQSYIFTTEGHPLSVRSNWHEKLPKAYNLSYESSIKLKRALNVNGEQNGGSTTFAKDCKDD